MSPRHGHHWQTFRETRLRPVLARGGAVWSQLSPRERRLCGAAVLLLAAAVSWWAGLKPALDTLRQARTQLPVLLAQSAELDAIMLESRALGRERRGAMTLEETVAALRDSLHAAGLQGQGRFAPPSAIQDGAQLVLTVERMPVAGLLAWLAQLPGMARVRVLGVDLTRSHIDGRDRPGLLSGTVTLFVPAGVAS
jgi:general secretion pathway protein M